MYKAAAFVFIVCFFLYILFSRKPDYFDSEFTPGYVVLPDNSNYTDKAVQYKVGHQSYKIKIEGWGASQVSKGEKVQVIYNPTYPEEGSLYTFFAYWIKFPELIISVIVFIGLFVGAILITGENEEPVSRSNGKQRKYKD